MKRPNKDIYSPLSGESQNFQFKNYILYIHELEKYIDYLESNRLPLELTAENGAKALLTGEFHEIMEDEDSPGNPYIVPVRWITIKNIYKKIVLHYTNKTD